MRGELLVIAGIVLIFTGFLMVFIGTMMSALSGESNVDVETGGVIMIGPIPIVFGTQKGATIAMLLAIVLMILWIAVALLGRRV
ncbi:hypothetical protein PAP_09205 [Palaeococcus pacificus DY20341]|uniref:TIGR00304 family protein n=1 Tax=Palaeococcus pacificus DY20341 TaxID=1343739 RepID=A0A075LV70_9EURY|nr:TIGR00304 family protein [Palaeococcus pacificus]AIF70219.1 hypothetical protein PAP_09205 [Palaeococcus pacificus DY20341]